MGEPVKLLYVTPQERATAEEQRVDSLKHSAHLFVGAGNALSVVALLAPKSAHIIGHLGLGLDIKSLKHPAPTIKPGPLSILYVVPPPFGIVPPEYYGVSPTYMKEVAPWLPSSAFLATATTPERASVFSADDQRRRAENEVLSLISTGGIGRAEQLHKDIATLRPAERQTGTVLEFQTEILQRELTFHKIAFTPVAFFPPDEPPAQLPSAITSALDLVGAAFAAANSPAPQVPDPAAQQKADPTLHPQLIKAGNTLAIASAAAAEGIRRELPTEIADP